MKPSGIGGQHSRENHVGEDHQCNTSGGRTDGSPPCGKDTKGSPVARRDSMGDERRDSRSERSDGYPLEWRAKGHHRHEYDPCPRIGDCEEDGERVPSSCFRDRYHLPEALLRCVGAQPSEHEEDDSQAAVCRKLRHSDLDAAAPGYE